MPLNAVEILSIEDLFEDFLKTSKMDKKLLTPGQLTSVRSVFFAGISQVIKGIIALHSIGLPDQLIPVVLHIWAEQVQNYAHTEIADKLAAEAVAKAKGGA